MTEEVFKDYLKQVNVDRKQSYRNLTVLPYLKLSQRSWRIARRDKGSGQR